MSDNNRIGESVQGRYRLERLIGTGGFGTVYEARHLEMGTQVALKILHPEHTRDAHTVKRFELEARRSAALKHPNTIRVFDYGHTDTDELFIAMEYLEGRSLKHLLAHEHLLAFGRVVHILTQILRALDEAHLAGLVHRDLKPDNVFLLEIGREKDFVKVLDFGIAKAMREDAALTTTGTLIGTPLYMSPEQCRGRELDGRSDLYSLGCIAYELLTGRTPFRANDAFGYAIAHLQETPPDPREVAGPGRPIPEGLVHWVLRLLEKDPAARFEDAAAANEALASALAGAATWEFAEPSSVNGDGNGKLATRGPPGFEVSGGVAPQEQGSLHADQSERRPSERETREAAPATSRPGRPWWFWTGLGAIAVAALAVVLLAWPRADGGGADISKSETTPLADAQETLADDARLVSLLRFIPRSAWFVIGVRPELLRTSAPLTLGYQRMCDAMYDASPLGVVGARQVFVDAGLLVMGITTQPEGPPPLGRIVVIASPDPGRVRQPALDLGARFDDAPFPWLRLPDGGGFVIEPGRVAAANELAMADMLGARDAKSMLPAGVLAPMLERVAPGAPVFVVMLMPAELRADLEREIPGLGRALWLGGRLRLQPTAGVQIYLEFRNAEMARDAYGELERKLAELRSLRGGTKLGMAEVGIISTLETRLDGAVIALEAAIPEDTLATLLETLGLREQKVEPAPEDSQPVDPPPDPEPALPTDPADPPSNGSDSPTP